MLIQLPDMKFVYLLVASSLLLQPAFSHSRSNKETAIWIDFDGTIATNEAFETLALAAYSSMTKKEVAQYLPWRQVTYLRKKRKKKKEKKKKKPTNAQLVTMEESMTPNTRISAPPLVPATTSQPKSPIVLPPLFINSSPTLSTVSLMRVSSTTPSFPSYSRLQLQLRSVVGSGNWLRQPRTTVLRPELHLSTGASAGSD